jgi:hypothetical protein
MKKIILTLLATAISISSFAEVVNVQVGKIKDDEGIQRTIIIFKDYEDAKKSHECKSDEGYDVPAYLVSREDKIIPACWLPAHTDGIGSFQYLNSESNKEFDFNEKIIKFKQMRFDNKALKLIGIK